MPVVRITWFAGRTREQKEEVAKCIEDLMVRRIGVPEGETHVIYEDVAREDWATAGKLKG